MPKLYLTLKNSKIKKISVYLNPYQTGFISFGFENQHEAELAHIAAYGLGTINSPINRLGNELIFMDLNQTDVLLTNFVSLGLVHDQDRSDLAELLEEV